MDTANQYARAQRSKAVSYTWGALATMFVLFLGAADRIKTSRLDKEAESTIEKDKTSV